MGRTDAVDLLTRCIESSRKQHSLGTLKYRGKKWQELVSEEAEAAAATATHHRNRSVPSSLVTSSGSSGSGNQIR